MKSTWQIAPNWISPLFYSGVLISSIGTGAFGTAMFSYLLLNQFSLSQAALLLGLQRLVPTLVVAIAGHWTDRWSPRSTIVVAEIIASALSLALLLVWRGPETSLIFLGALSVGRAVIGSFQLGSRAKISKLLSGTTYAGNSRHAMWLNKATQGASLFSGGLAWVFVTYGSLEGAIIFDFATFVLNGLIVFALPKLEEAAAETAPDSGPQSVERWYQKFHSYVVDHRETFLSDVALFVCTGGLIAYSARIAGSEAGWAGLFVAAYGLSVWVSGFMERSLTSKLSLVPYWIGIGVCYIALGQFDHANVLAIVISFLKDFCFWVIFHRVSSGLQMRTPMAKMGSVASARAVVIVIISAGAEIAVGAWSNVISLPVESALRAVFAIGVGFYLYSLKRSKREELKSGNEL